MNPMQNKTVMITGASKGIGAQAVRVFANVGANIVLLARSRSEIDQLATEIQTPALAIECDVGRFSDVENATNAAIQRFGKVDVLINNAGTIQPISRLSKSDPDAWGQAIDTNLKGVYYGARAVLPSMIAGGGGTILTRQVNEMVGEGTVLRLIRDEQVNARSPAELARALRISVLDLFTDPPDLLQYASNRVRISCEAHMATPR